MLINIFSGSSKELDKLNLKVLKWIADNHATVHSVTQMETPKVISANHTDSGVYTQLKNLKY